ncbi:hypothetical protein POJ06DRAFT_280794 [Lipomyces tetrasporus]|uniref:DH domain-containing protein n=1 Tax=Lipomyces tetrasporus TaxID=54092 RepID=A0AAD7VU92_9ASCO|nr:uncharacterized protein POJ06DRAFT_280794 [Lipomyces tetrasporus]KAJ8102293.1 hypothetical protein POJ06DRAFT_280794 [Lipomyces tetrasporus]
MLSYHFESDNYQENPIGHKANLPTNLQKNGSSVDYIKADKQLVVAENSKSPKSDIDTCIANPDVGQWPPAIPKLAITESIAIPSPASSSFPRVENTADQDTQAVVRKGSPNAPDSSSGSSPDAVFTPAGSVGSQTSSSANNDKDLESRLPDYKDLSDILPAQIVDKTGCPAGYASEATSISNLHIIRRVNSQTSNSLPSLMSTPQSSIGIDFTSTESLRAQRRRMCIEEFISTEQSYLSGLRLLVNTYLATLESCDKKYLDVSADIRDSANALIEFHQDIISSIYASYPTLYAPSTAYTESAISDFGITRKEQPDVSVFEKEIISAFNGGQESSKWTWTRPNISVSSPMVAATIAQLIQKKVSDLVIYEQYCLNYNNVIHILKDYRESKSKPLRNWSRGCENAALATQSESRRADLSLDALATNPTIRVMKYRLLIQELCKHTSPEDSTEAHGTLVSTLASVKESLKRLNSEFGAERSRATSSELWKRLEFEQPPAFEAQYLGRASLCGALHVAWIGKDSSSRSHYLGAFLFKSYLVLAHCQKSDKYPVKFLIPLCSSYLQPTGNGVGMQTTSQRSWKLMFECDFAVYEILLTAISAAEKETWQDQLLALICANNGAESYLWDFEASRRKASGHGPTALVPATARPLFVDARGSSGVPAVPRSPRRFSGSLRRQASIVYSREPIQIHVDHFLMSADELLTSANSPASASSITSKISEPDARMPSVPHSCEFAMSARSPILNRAFRRATSMTDTTCSPILSSLRPSSPNSPITDKRCLCNGPHMFILNIKRSDRISAESAIGFIWSEELPHTPPVEEISVSLSKLSLSLGTRILARKFSGSFKTGLSRRASGKTLPTYSDTIMTDISISNDSKKPRFDLHDDVLNEEDQDELDPLAIGSRHCEKNQEGRLIVKQPSESIVYKKSRQSVSGFGGMIATR